MLKRYKEISPLTEMFTEKIPGSLTRTPHVTPQEKVRMRGRENEGEGVCVNARQVT